MPDRHFTAWNTVPTISLVNGRVQVTRFRILAGAFSHVRGKQPTADGAAITHRTTELIDGIEYTWYPTPSYQRTGTTMFRR